MAPYTNVSGLYDTQRVGTLKGKTLTYIGDARNNVANDLLVTGALLGVNMNIVAPESRLPESHVVAMAKDYAEQTGATIQISSDIEKTVYQTDAIYTDVWFSMGEPTDVIEERVKALQPYQINMSLIQKIQNPDVKVLHCLPAFHNTQTQVGKDVYENMDYQKWRSQMRSFIVLILLFLNKQKIVYILLKP